MADNGRGSSRLKRRGRSLASATRLIGFSAMPIGDFLRRRPEAQTCLACGSPLPPGWVVCPAAGVGAAAPRAGPPHTRPREPRRLPRLSMRVEQVRPADKAGALAQKVLVTAARRHPDWPMARAKAYSLSGDVQVISVADGAFSVGDDVEIGGSSAGMTQYVLGRDPFCHGRSAARSGIQCR